MKVTDRASPLWAWCGSASEKKRENPPKEVHASTTDDLGPKCDKGENRQLKLEIKTKYEKQ
jgi:hypothetical protein